MKIFGSSVVGNYRENNEDSFAYEMFDDTLVAVVADGIGGAPAGEVASEMATKETMKYISNNPVNIDSPEFNDYIADLFNKVNIAILKASISEPDKFGMGTTMTVAFLKGTKLIVGHMGDSRAYLIHGTNVNKLTSDHNVAGQKVLAGEMTEEEARSSKTKSLLTKYLGENQFLSPDIYSYNIMYGDMLLMCTDGLYGSLSNQEIADCLRARRGNLEEATGLMTQRALTNGSKDNITCLLVNIKPGRIERD